jgi:gamma-glutamylcyclotransferase (GGCT)/AIG2-like uncharacterized protein YtfP
MSYLNNETTSNTFHFEDSSFPSCLTRMIGDFKPPMLTATPPTKSTAVDIGDGDTVHMCTLEIRPVFLYGTLMSNKLLSGLLTGEERHVNLIEKRRCPATICGYSRHAIVDADYPALVKSRSIDRVDGYLFYPRSMDDIKRLDDFESDSYCRDKVEVVDSDGRTIEAYAYVWCDGLEDLEEADWKFEEFERKYRQSS